MSNPQTTRGSAPKSWKTTQRRSTCMRHRRRRHQRRAAQLKQHQHVPVADPTYQAASKMLGMLHQRGMCERRILEHIHFHFICWSASSHILTSSFLCLACEGYVITLATRLVIFLSKAYTFSFHLLERVLSHFDVVVSLLGLRGVCDHVSNAARNFLVESTYSLNKFLEHNVFEYSDYYAMWKDWEPII